MSVYVDGLTDYGLGVVKEVPRARFWCHMYADDLDELHEMAHRIGMRRTWFQACPPHSMPHYDLTKSRRSVALKAGVVEKEIAMEDFTRWHAMSRRTSTSAHDGA